METPQPVRAVQPMQLHRRARLIVDEGGLFVAVDGDSLEQRKLVEQVLDMAMRQASPEAVKREPAVAQLSPLPLSYGSITGSVSDLVRERAIRMLREAGYVVG